jgi:PKD repeat protein
MKLKKIGLSLLLYYCCATLWAQCFDGTTGFANPATVCPKENVSFQNPFPGAARYEWDFCLDDLARNPNFGIVAAAIANIPTNPEVVFDGTEYFVFMLSRDSDELLRFDLGNSPRNTPQNIARFSLPAFDRPEPIRFVKEGTQWYAILSNTGLFGGNNNLVRLSFGTSLRNSPSAQDLGTLGVLNANRAIDLLQEGGQTYILTANINQNRLHLIRLGASVTHQPTAADIVRSIDLPAGTAPIALRGLRDCNSWKVLIAGIGNRMLMLHFSSGLEQAPTINDLGALGISQPAGVVLLQEGASFYALVAANSGQVNMLDFGNSLLNTPTRRLVTTLSTLVGASAVKHQGTWSFFVNDYLSNGLFRFNFDNSDASIGFSQAQNPPLVSFSRLGNKAVSLKAFDANGQLLAYYVGGVQVNPNAVVANFTANDVCLGQPITFVNSSEGSDANVQSWFWDFGDGITSSQKNPTHSYTNAGNYEVRLRVTANNACSNETINTVRVSAGVQADFREVATVCLGENINFENLSIFSNVPPDPATGFFWNFGDGTFSPFENPTKAYQQAGDFVISLRVRDAAGCEDLKTALISVVPAPQPQFALPSGLLCAGVPIAFTATSTVSASEWRWEVSGVGVFEQQNPTITFPTAGSYTIRLIARSANNCEQAFVRENIVIQAAPSIVFSDNSSNNSLTVSFQNQSSGAAAFLWDFGDGQSSTAINPTVTYTAPGQYVVRLSASSLSGCTAFFERVVAVGLLQADIALNAARIEEGQVIVEIENAGNTIAENLLIKIYTAQDTLSEVIAERLVAGASLTYTLTNTLVEEALRSGFVCVELSPLPQEINLENNRICLNLKGGFEVFAPYPNPASEQVRVRYLALGTAPLQVEIRDMQGRLVAALEYPPADFGELVLDVSRFGAGLYLLTVREGAQATSKKVVIRR